MLISTEQGGGEIREQSSTIKRLGQTFRDYFRLLGYRELPASSLIPLNDPSVLFTTAGMQQFRDYYQHPATAPASAVVTVQPVVRTTDIEAVGDETHLTVFEMLGHFRFGETDSQVMKAAAIKEAWEFMTKKLGVDRKRLTATVFAGDRDTPADRESKEIWAGYGVPITEAGRAENFWGPTGEEGPCGPTTEIYLDGIEVWNLVFNQYYRDRSGNFNPLEKCGLDTGAGLERLSAGLQEKSSVWEIEPFSLWLEMVGELDIRERRILVDHLRAIVFLASIPLKAGNKGREYVLRRLLRTAIFLATPLNDGVVISQAIEAITSFYQTEYHLLSGEKIREIYNRERQLFQANLERALRYLDSWLKEPTSKDSRAITEKAFSMYESYGLPKELVLNYLVSQGSAVDRQYFRRLFADHQAVSRQGNEKQFKGGLADHDHRTIEHHSAHHLLLAALRQVLGPTVVQRGSNITRDRLRLDFSFDRKLTAKEVEEVEEMVNQKIKADLPVTSQETDREEAIRSGALAEFGAKYGQRVTVYSIGGFSKELCGGPHVARTGELGKFKILKEEASSQGVRRIKAQVE